MTVNNNQTKELQNIEQVTETDFVEDNSGCMDAEHDYDEYFDKHEVEEYISVVHNELPCRQSISSEDRTHEYPISR
jgi:hypothetical protein